jgi:hypothetical protein
MGASAPVAIMRLREREVVEDFRHVGATSPADAKTLEEVGIGESRAFQRLVERAVIKEATPGCYYLDEESWTAIRRMRRRMVGILLITVLLIFVATMYGVVTTSR